VDAKLTVIRSHELSPHDRGGGVRTSYLVTPVLGAAQFLNGITEFDPGAELPFHSHNCEESVVVLEGTALFERDGQTTQLEPFDTTFVPAGVVHRFANHGASTLRILWTYGSVAATRTLAATGETFPIGSAADQA
jgi:quercetin dioxygenase-like cupin family protein